ncbi:hypothetical protein V5O48_016531 [Marasmius crinis-equi]|uniref:Uncharacterized protein n=1 Tax=Marasmius crinis-equi TaxID=585013 RepID=A0ABR3ERJ2_9AGAR
MKDPVPSAKNVKGTLLKNGVDVTEKKAKKKAVEEYEDDVLDEEMPACKKPRILKAKTTAKSGDKSGKKSASKVPTRSPPPSVEEVEDEEETPQQRLDYKAWGWTSGGVKQYQDSKNSTSTKDLGDHVRKCMGKATYEKVMASGKKPNEVREMIRKHAQAKNKDIAQIFDGMRKAGIRTYSNVEHTPQQTRAEIVHWVSESCRPFEIVADRGYLELMKRGRPHYWIPHPTMVSRDVKKTLARTCQRVSQILREYEGDINFTTDAWTSANHGVFVAITAHIVMDGKCEKLLLDFFEVAESHTGKTLAREFARVLSEFGIQDKLFKTKGEVPTEVEQQELLKLLEQLETGDKVEMDDKDIAAVREEAEKVREEMRKAAGVSAKPKRRDAVGKDDMDGFIDSREGLSDEVENELEDEVAPVQGALAKIRGLV